MDRSMNADDHKLNMSGNQYIGSFYSEEREGVIHILKSGYSWPPIEYICMLVNCYEHTESWFASKEGIISDFGLRMA